MTEKKLDQPTSNVSDQTKPQSGELSNEQLDEVSGGGGASTGTSTPVIPRTKNGPLSGGGSLPP